MPMDMPLLSNRGNSSNDVYALSLLVIFCFKSHPNMKSEDLVSSHVKFMLLKLILSRKLFLR